MMDRLLELLNADACTDARDLAVMLGTTEEEVRRKIADYEAQGVIRGYKPLLD